jgi:hypothetical protein
MILRPKYPATRFREAPSFVTELGNMLIRLEDAIITATGAPRVYVLRFSEAQSSVHFHLFPRTDDIAREYARAMNRGLDNLIGPELFEWVRQRTHVDDASGMSKTTIDTAEAIRRILEQAADRYG